LLILLLALLFWQFISTTPSSLLSSSASSLSFSLFVCILNLCYVILYAGHRYFVFAANLSQYPSIFFYFRKVSVSKQNIATYTWTCIGRRTVYVMYGRYQKAIFKFFSWFLFTLSLSIFGCCASHHMKNRNKMLSYLRSV